MTIGYMICNSEAETMGRFQPLTAYLASSLGVRLEAVAIDTVNFMERVEDLDFTHTNSILYVMMHRNFGVEILAGEKAGSLGARSRGAVVALRKSGITSLSDIRGKTMLFGPMYAPTAYMTQLDILQRNGIDPEDDLAFYSFPSGSFKHEKVIYGVWFGAAQVGAFPLLDFERMVEAGKIEAEDFVILEEGPAIPYCNFAATQRVDDALAKAFQKALLDLDRDDTIEMDGEKIHVLRAAWVDGYELFQDSDFDIVREMARRTNMPPYQKY